MLRWPFVNRWSFRANGHDPSRRRRPRRVQRAACRSGSSDVEPVERADGEENVERARPEHRDREEGDERADL